MLSRSASCAGFIPENGFGGCGGGTGRTWSSIRRPVDLDAVANEVLHGILGPHPRPAAARPTRPGAQDHLHAQFSGLHEGMRHVVLPRFAHERNRPARHPEIDFKKQHAADTDFFHGMQVRDHLVAVLVAIHEIPVNARARRVWRIPESINELIGVKASGKEAKCEKKIGFALFHRSASLCVESQAGRAASQLRATARASEPQPRSRTTCRGAERH